jgi:hypothetical protein
MVVQYSGTIFPDNLESGTRKNGFFKAIAVRSQAIVTCPLSGFCLNNEIRKNMNFR